VDDTFIERDETLIFAVNGELEKVFTSEVTRKSG
jgi:hypothetical protein